MQKERSMDYKCILCRDTGIVMYEKDGLEFAKECSCGLRKKEHLQKMLSFANIPDAFMDMSLDTFRKDVYRYEESKEIIEVNYKAITWWLSEIERMKKDGMGLYLYSNCKGSGKTRMAASIANELIHKYDMSVKFATSVHIINEIKASWDKEDGMSEHKLLEELSYAEVLVIDDFGIETVRDWIGEKIYQIINQRYINKRITIFTSNLSIDELQYDDRITNRIREKCYMLAFPNESIRNYISEMNMAELRAAIA